MTVVLDRGERRERDEPAEEPPGNKGKGKEGWLAGSEKKRKKIM